MISSRIHHWCLFDRDWETIRKNAEWIVQLHSAGDDLIPVEEGRFVAEKLQSEYIELEGRVHFMEDELPEVARVIKEKTVSVEVRRGEISSISERKR